MSESSTASQGGGDESFERRHDALELGPEIETKGHELGLHFLLPRVGVTVL